MGKKKIKLIYIAGTGHSGTTLISLIIGSSKNCLPLGELHFLQEYKKSSKKFLCDCGKPLEQCEFWSKIVYNVDTNKLFLLNDSLWNKVKFILSVLFYPLTKPNFKKYTDSKLYQLITNHPECNGKIVVDSSKVIRRMCYLSTLSDIDLKIVHCVRDCRGVICSYERKGQNWAKTFMVWLLTNSILSIIKSKGFIKSNYIRLSYDQFTVDPIKFIRKINRKFELNISENFLDEINNAQYHIFAGNRLRKRKISSISRDISWNSKFPLLKKIIINIIAFVPNKIWVYNREF